MVCHFPPHLQFLLGGLPSHPPPSWLVYKDLDALVVAWPSANISHIYLLFTSQASKRECHQSITKSHTESDTLKANSNSICSDRLLWNVSFSSSSSSLFDDIAPLRGKIKFCSSSSWRFTRADTTTTTSCKSKRRLAFLQL